LILSLLVASLTFITSASFAAPGAGKGAGGWEPAADHHDSVVISLHSDPLVDPEPACVALQIGMNLLMDSINVSGSYMPVTPADEVVLFVTTGGVELINPANDLSANVCFTPAGPDSGSLEMLLQGFINMGGKVEICPLCAMGRNITAPTQGTMANGVDVHNLFLYADKVINF
jgi:hypothetical protein